MKLGGGYVKLSQKLPLEASEGEAELDFLEHRGVDKAKGFTVASPVVSANGFSKRARRNGHLVIVFFAERKVNLITFLEAEDVDVGVNGGGDENQIKEAFINGGRGHPPSHLKFFLLVFSKLKEDIK